MHSSSNLRQPPIPQSRAHHDTPDNPSTPSDPKRQAQSASDTMRFAASGLSAHLVYQVSARLFSFLIKALVVRALRPAQFAFVEIRVALLVTLALLPSFTGVRPVALRLSDDHQAHALALFGALTTILLAFVLGLLAIFFDPANCLALSIVLLSVFIRAFSELPVIVARRRQLFAATSRARAFSILVSGITQTLAVSLVSSPVYAAAATSTSHVTYVVALGLSITLALRPTGGLPSFSPTLLRQHLRKDHLVMAAVSSFDGFIKFLLENAEAIVLDICCPNNVQAAYKVAANLGSVFARFFSEALEEQAFNVFSTLSPSFRHPSDPASHPRRAACEEMLLLGLKAAISVSLLFAVVGPPFAYAVIRLLYGPSWADRTDAPAVLSLYLLYIVFMAANGVSEAFVSASASTPELKSRTKFTTILSTAYIISLYFAARKYGTTGVIIVNCANMAFRTFYSTWFFTKLTTRPLRFLLINALPHPGLVAVLLFSRYIAQMSEHALIGVPTPIKFQSGSDMLVRIGTHALSGVLSLVLFAASLLTFEANFIRRVRKLRSKQD